VRFWALLFVACAAAAATTEFAYTIPAPPGSRVEAPALTTQGDWEVSLSFDRERCEIACVYRLRSGRAPLFLPPLVSVRIYSGMNVSTVTFDPAHTREHSCGGVERLSLPEDALPARAAPALAWTTVATVVTRAAARPPSTVVVRAANAPLRI